MQYSYRNAGVNVENGEKLTNLIKKTVNKNAIGDFAGLFSHSIFKDYFFAACTDGVGTKIIPLIEREDTKTLACDLVAMNLNDLICTGAKPLFFLDYIAANRLDVRLLHNFIDDLNDCLLHYECTLLGGETSELGDLILNKYFDAAGFMAGAVHKNDVIHKKNVSKGDIVIGLKSSGAHSNGFSLLRKLHADRVLSDELFNQALKPTKIYYDIVMLLNEKKLLKSCANITGGGILANLKRAVPDDLNISLDYDKISLFPLFSRLVEILGKEEAFRTFNMGIGFCLVVSKNDVDRVLEMAKDYEPLVFGEVV